VALATTLPSFDGLRMYFSLADSIGSFEKIEALKAFDTITPNPSRGSR
jgi:hypothetical protein